jgi:serine/threonine protein phosphatase PrpC
LISKNLSILLEDENAVPSIIKSSFKKMQIMLINSPINIELSGSTCCLVLVTAKHVITANVGDSRSIAVNMDNKALRVLTKDHNPNDQSERKRVILSNGRIEPLYGQ